MEVYAAFADTPNLLDRGMADGVGDLYARMHERGELVTYAGRVVPPGRRYHGAGRGGHPLADGLAGPGCQRHGGRIGGCPGLSELGPDPGGFGPWNLS